jgi:hypothetical protein
MVTACHCEAGMVSRSNLDRGVRMEIATLRSQ